MVSIGGESHKMRLGFPPRSLKATASVAVANRSLVSSGINIYPTKEANPEHQGLKHSFD